jgi:hypothetical protein
MAAQRARLVAMIEADSVSLHGARMREEWPELQTKLPHI